MDIETLKRQHEERVAELIRDNSRFEQRARDAEQEAAGLRATVELQAREIGLIKSQVLSPVSRTLEKERKHGALTSTDPKCVFVCAEQGPAARDKLCCSCPRHADSPRTAETVKP